MGIAAAKGAVPVLPELIHGNGWLVDPRDQIDFDGSTSVATSLILHAPNLDPHLGNRKRPGPRVISIATTNDRIGEDRTLND